MTHYIVNQNVNGKITTPLFYYNCRFSPGTYIKNGSIIRPMSKLQQVILKDCFVENAFLEGTKLQGNISIVRSSLHNCNLTKTLSPTFNDCVLTYQGKNQYTLPVLDGTFIDCSLNGYKLIEPTIRNSLSLSNSALIYDEKTLLSPTRGYTWNFFNTKIINADIDQ